MSQRSLMREIPRALAFARHIPLRKVIRRLTLDAKRRIAQSSHNVAPAPPPPVGACKALRPPFAPRRGKVRRVPEGRVFEFLGRRIYAGDIIDWRAGGEGSTHQLWRMNLHYMEYLEEVDDADFIDLVSQWFDANPPYRPHYWADSWNSYALSLRIVVWMQQFALRQERLGIEMRDRLLSSLAQQIRFLENNLETDIGGNHLVKNLKALILASTLFKGDEALRWRRRALRMLAEEISTQILPDGVHYERSPSYHCQVFADLLECRHALGNDPLEGALDAALDRMAQATADLAHPDGGVAQFNDAGLTMAYSPAECLAVYGSIFNRQPAARAHFEFPHAGYFGCRSGDNYFIADCGRIAPDDLPAHGHGDVLSFEWSIGGRRFIVDQGVFEYLAGERRRAARSAASHNTLCLAGADQADFFGAFRCGRRPNIDLRLWRPHAEGFVLEGSHDGYSHLPGRPIHLRRFEIGPGELDITDRISPSSVQGGAISFLLHPEVVATIENGRCVLECGGKQISFTSSLPATKEPAVWWPDMGTECATTRLVIKLPPGVEESQIRFAQDHQNLERGAAFSATALTAELQQEG